MQTTSRLMPPSSRAFCTCSPRQAFVKGARRNPNLIAHRTKRSGKPLSTSLPQTELFHSLLDISAITSRPSLINEDTARDLVRAWGCDKMHDLVVVEPYAGPGGLTRAFLELKNVKRVIAVEQAWRYMPSLKALQEREPERLKIIDDDPFTWEAYSKVQSEGYLDDVPKVPWDQIHPSFFLATQLPNNRHGEQLFIQFLNCSAGKMWYYQYGRFSSGVLAPKSYWNKLTAPPATSSHHKLAVLMPALAKFHSTDPLHDFSPADYHFHRPRAEPAIYGAMKVTPHLTPAVSDFEVLEYVAKNMFVTKGVAWRKALQTLAAGAENLLPAILSNPIMIDSIKDPSRTVNELTMEEWGVISQAFGSWPFRPKVLFDDGGFTSGSEY